MSNFWIDLRKGYLDVQVEISKFRQEESVRCRVTFSVIQPEGTSCVGDSAAAWLYRNLEGVSNGGRIE